ncbi:MAG: ketoacyl-ACP synthase III, partial [Massilia sp.]|nr:ketoacyl-ACP synthase III [Massilia sp.]
EAEQIDLIIVATSTPDFFGSFPSTACIVQNKLGMRNNSAAFDMGAVCSGFVYALSTADAFIKAGNAKNVLVIGTEVFSRILDFDDRSTCVLFGDGAGAVVLTASEEPGVLAVKLHADGSYGDILCGPANPSNLTANQKFLYMDGPAVFKLAVTVLEKVANEALAAAQMPASSIDWLIPHQANLRIMTGTAKKLGLSAERMVVTVHEHGNTSAASIPLALDAAVRDGRIKPGHNVMMEGVGGGFTWGAVLARM